MAQNQAVVTLQRFSQGLTYDDYVAQVKVNRDQFEKNYQEFQLSLADQDSYTRQRPKKIRVLALGEDWCPDVYRGLPILAKIAQAAGMELRVFPRDQNLDIMDQYLNQGKFRSIPTFVFFSSDLKYLGSWIERPAGATRLIADLRDELAKSGKSEKDQRIELMKRMQAMWNEWRQETAGELKALIATFA